MYTDSLNSPTDGNGANRYRKISYIVNPNLSGPDVLESAENAMGNQNSFTPPAVKLTKASQQAMDYYNRVSSCQNCK